ncbi:PAS-domain containing protein [Paracoccaceae bacterium]
MSLILAIGLVATAFLSAMAGLFINRAAIERRGPSAQSIFSDSNPGTVFLFDGETLVDGSAAARALIHSLQGTGGPWARLIQHLTPRFPDLEAGLAALAERGALHLVAQPAKGPPLLLQAELRGGLTRLQLSAPGAASDSGPDPFTHNALAEEVEGLRRVIAGMPGLCWREDSAGEVVWANTAYLLAAMDNLPPGQELTWPLPRLFERRATDTLAHGQRLALNRPGRSTRWFDVAAADGPEGERLLFAGSADALVQAEATLRDFMQTLTKTFAQLPIGLAIFDSQRQLQLFNPALLDLTGLPPDFLTLRPSLLSVLDALRDRNMLPEPKDYRGWRRQLVDMERAASQGLYEETWNLADGQTFRVSGRPHPNGALALMIEDISTEMLRTRRYRADLELGQSVIDAMEEAVAVFSREGHLVMTNAAYAALWAHDPTITVGEVPVRALAHHWRALTAPAALWSEVEDYVSTVGDRLTWQAEARLLDGRALICRFAPLAGGATLAAFRLAAGRSEAGRNPVEEDRRRA